MKNLRFIDLLLLSPKEGTARRLNFDKSLTVLKGNNDTGKSSLLKSIYATLGATPHHVTPRWKRAHVQSSLRFSLDGAQFRVVSAGGLFGIFDHSDRLLASFSSISKTMAPYFAKLFRFNLPLRTRSGFQQATPAFLYLPFCFDQDGSWGKNWNSFERLQQFQSWRYDVAAFHAGIRPSEYYSAKSKLGEAEDLLKDLRARRELLDTTLKQVEKRLNLGGFNMDISAYEAEVRELLARCATLQKKEEAFKSQLLTRYEARATFESQIQVANEAVRELRKDLQYATDKLPPEATCPTCGTHHDNSFAERFSIAADEDRCRELIVELTAKLEGVRSAITKAESLTSAAAEEVAGIQEILQKRQSDVEFRDVLKGQGRRELKEVLAEERAEFNLAIGKQDGLVEAAAGRLDQLKDSQISKRVHAKFRELMARFLLELDIGDLGPTDYRKIDCSIRMSGSEQPRALLAYYFAYLNLVAEGTTSTFCPVVIDSPRQQDIDPENWRRMLKFIEARRPADSQMILSVVDTGGVKLSGSVIELTEKKSAMRRDHYEDVASELTPLVDCLLGL